MQFLDCELGNYGADCKQTCSSGCYNNTCDLYTGVCSEGCLPGYIPPYCKNSKINVYYKKIKN